jgi:hypothetical protein
MSESHNSRPYIHTETWYLYLTVCLHFTAMNRHFLFTARYVTIKYFVRKLNYLI